MKTTYCDEDQPVLDGGLFVAVWTSWQVDPNFPAVSSADVRLAETSPRNPNVSRKSLLHTQDSQPPHPHPNPKKHF